jgi:hypothetical protein
VIDFTLEEKELQSGTRKRHSPPDSFKEKEVNMPLKHSSSLFRSSWNTPKNKKIVLIVLVFVTLTGTLVLYGSLFSRKAKSQYRSPESQASFKNEQISNTSIQALLLDDVLAEYTLRNDRAPPKRFIKWFEFAHSKKCFTDMSLYDSIYKDLAPFFALGQEDFKKRLQVLLKNTRNYRSLDVLKISGGRASGSQTERVESVSSSTKKLKCTHSSPY